MPLRYRLSLSPCKDLFGTCRRPSGKQHDSQITQIFPIFMTDLVSVGKWHEARVWLLCNGVFRRQCWRPQKIKRKKVEPKTRGFFWMTVFVFWGFRDWNSIFRRSFVISFRTIIKLYQMFLNSSYSHCSLDKWHSGYVLFNFLNQWLFS